MSYLGIKNLRDSCRYETSVALWRTVNTTVGARFCAFIPSTGPTGMQAALSIMPELYRSGMCDYFEGPNEPDGPYAVSQGNSITIARAFQVTDMTNLVKVYHRKLLNMSFGAGWTATNYWHGDYDKVGDMSAFCDFANAHTYPNYNIDPAKRQHTTAQIKVMNGLANMAAISRPVITSEIGWDKKLGWSAEDVAKCTLQAAFGGVVNGNPMTYFYALYDDPNVNAFGLMSPTGTPTLAGIALHNLMAIIHPTTSLSLPTDAPTIQFTSMAGDYQVMLDGLDGSYWLAIWNEVSTPRSATITFTNKPTGISQYNPLHSITPSILPISSANQISIPISDEVILLKIVK